MATYAPTIEKPICTKCGKIGKRTIYEHEKDDYLCDKCFSKVKFIDTKELKGKIDKSLDNMYLFLGSFIKRIEVEQKNLNYLKTKYKLDKFNEGILNENLLKIFKFKKRLIEVYEEYLTENSEEMDLDNLKKE